MFALVVRGFRSDWAVAPVAIAQAAIKNIAQRSAKRVAVWVRFTAWIHGVRWARAGDGIRVAVYPVAQAARPVRNARLPCATANR